MTNIDPSAFCEPNDVHLAEHILAIEKENDQLKEQIGFLTTILRSNHVHESTCPVPQAIAHNRLGMSYMVPQPCDCWLSEEIYD